MHIHTISGKAYKEGGQTDSQGNIDDLMMMMFSYINYNERV
jgi:hypothetical protein